VARRGALPEREAIAWASQLLDGLGYCHSQGVIHRDIKPQNVIIAPDGRAVLVDFGLVKLWDPTDPRTKTVMRGFGTPEYAPPEQYDVSGGHTDPRSDIYGLGATLYHALTGQAPPTATQRMANPASFRAPRLLNQHISAHFEQIILKAMEPQPAHRYQGAHEMMTALATATPAPAATVAPARQSPRRVVKEPARAARARKARVPTWAWASGCAVLLVLAVVGIVVVVGAGGGLMLSSSRSRATPISTSTQPPTALREGDGESEGEGTSEIEAGSASGGVRPIIIGTADSVTDLDPAQAMDYATWEILHNTMDTLLRFRPGSTELEPGLADSCEVNEDGLEYTCSLRRGLEFADGAALNADAVVWSLERVTRLASGPEWLITAFVDRVEKVDDYTVRFTLLSPVGFFPALLAAQPYSPVSPSCYPEDAMDSDSTCGGIGPYRIVRWERDEELELEANPDYYGTPPAHPRIVVRYFPETSSLRAALESGKIDVAWSARSTFDRAAFQSSAAYNLYDGYGPMIRYVCFNATIPPFDDQRVRRALALAVDREAISEGVFGGTHESLYSFVPNGMVSHIDAFGDRDLAQAKALLAEAGFDTARPLVVDLWWTTEYFGPAEGELAAAIKEAFEETGVIEVNLQSAEWATYIDAAFTQGSMPVYLMRWFPDFLDPDSYVYPGFLHYSEELDGLLTVARFTPDMEYRWQLYEEVQHIWTEEVPAIPLTQRLSVVVTQKDVKGVVIDLTQFLHYDTLARE
jgi:peptide/nickel transport system substrate-binding protein